MVEIITTFQIDRFSKFLIIVNIISAHFAKLFKLHSNAITNSKFLKLTVYDMHYRIRYVHVKYQRNWVNRFVKTVHEHTKKILNCINLQLAVRISKNRSFQTCITRPPIFRPNLRSIGLLVIVQTRSKYISTGDGRTDGRTDIASDDIR